jgi:hypothetical protein
VGGGRSTAVGRERAAQDWGASSGGGTRRWRGEEAGRPFAPRSDEKDGEAREGEAATAWIRCEGGGWETEVGREKKKLRFRGIIDGGGG